MRLAFLHHRITENVGDVACGPEAYFKFPGCHIERLPWQVLWNDTKYEADVVIVGGGGMFTPYAWKHFDDLRARFPERLVFWGIGLNNPTPRVETDLYPGWLPGDSLATGVRDYISGQKWVPCVSCMSSAFDEEYDEPKYDYVLYEHKDIPILLDGVPDMPRSTNYAHKKVGSVLEFLAQGRTVLTSSYHGAYWATLLGRRVIMWSFSTKFLYMKHKHPILERDTILSGYRLRDLMAKTKAYPEALQECRQLNIDFHTGVMNKLAAIKLK